MVQANALVAPTLEPLVSPSAQSVMVEALASRWSEGDAMVSQP